MLPADAVPLIRRFNQGLDPTRLALKFRAMRASEFSFFRGTCHLFYRDLPPVPAVDHAPLAWICGDLHLENFGSYKGDNRLSYFDLNDFDEACLAPCTWEVLRFLSSLLTGGPELGLSRPDSLDLCQAFLSAYRTGLSSGKPRWIERPLATGLIRTLLFSIKRTERRRFLDTRTRSNGKRRTLLVDGKKAYRLSGPERTLVSEAIERFAQTRPDPGFYRVLDMANRISGLGSLGINRYVLLVEGRGSPDGNFLLDLKEARPSSPSPFLPLPQPAWRDEAERIVTVQGLVQAIPPALFHPLRLLDRSFLLKELQPSEHRVNLAAAHGSLKQFRKVVESMGALTAWGQLRGASFRGSAARESLLEFGKSDGWILPLLALAKERSLLMKKSWKDYGRAFDQGTFGEDAPE